MGRRLGPSNGAGGDQRTKWHDAAHHYRRRAGAGAAPTPLRIRGGITTSNLLFVPSPRHGLISLVPWDSTASVADLETAAVNSPRILSSSLSESRGQK